MWRVAETWRRVVLLLRRDRVSRELDAELRFHLDMAAQEHREAGVPPDEAAFAARRQFGNLTQVRERSAEAWTWTSVEQVARDVRLAARALGRTPGFVVAAVFTLAVGIGANAAIFSVINGVLLRPLPFDRPESLVSLRHTADIGPLRQQSAATFLTYRDEQRAFEAIALFQRVSRPVTIPGADGPDQVETFLVTDAFLDVLGIDVAAGRDFLPDDDAPASPIRALVSHGFWQRALGGDPTMVGRHLVVDGEPCEIVGILPRSARFPGNDPALLLPIRLNRATTTIGNHGPQGIGRLKDGVGLDEANRDIARLIPLIVEKFPLPAGVTRQEYDAIFRFGPDVRPLASTVVGDVGRVLWILMGTAAFVLLIACANVASLFLVRAEGRLHELAVRAALGAGRIRLARELLAESFVLASGGGALGLAIAHGGLRLLVALAPAGLPRLEEIVIDARVLAFTAAISLLSGITFGLLPLARLSRPPIGALRGAGRGTTVGRGRQRATGALVAAEVALALVLLVGAGLMVRTFQAMRGVQIGTARPHEVLTFQVGIPRGLEPDIDTVIRIHQRIADRLQQVPGVASVGLTTSVPMDGRRETDGFLVEGAAEVPGRPRETQRVKWVSGRYFETVGTPILAGRAIAWTDALERRPVVMISENMARRHWKSPAAAVGRHLRETPENPWREIVGVVGDERDDGVTEEAPHVVYLPLMVADWWDVGTYGQRYLIYAVRAATIGSPAFLKQMQDAVWSIDRRLPLSRVRTLEEIGAQATARTRFVLVMLALAAGVALALGAVGLYGVVSYAVTGRAREIGVRIALGASTAQVRRLFVRRGVARAAVGVGAGLVAALALSHTMAALLFEVTPLDPPTYVAVAVLLLVVALAASYAPARRASRVNPVEALRSGG